MPVSLLALVLDLFKMHIDNFVEEIKTFSATLKVRLKVFDYELFDNKVLENVNIILTITVEDINESGTYSIVVERPP